MAQDSKLEIEVLIQLGLGLSLIRLRHSAMEPQFYTAEINLMVPTLLA